VKFIKEYQNRMFIEAVLTGLLANQLSDSFKGVGKWFSESEDDKCGDELYSCFDKAAEKYCKNIKNSIEGGIANLFIWHKENWEEVYKILDLTNGDVDINKFNKLSICGNYTASFEMVRSFVGHVKEEIIKCKPLYNEINSRKQSFETNKIVKKISLDFSQLLAESKNKSSNFKNANLKIEIDKSEIEDWIHKIFENDHGLDWIESEIFLSIRKLLLEIAVNRFFYGGANKCILKVTGKTFKLIDDGDEFNTKYEFIHNKANLKNGGGLDYFNGFLDEHANKVTVAYSQENSECTLSFNFNEYDKLVRKHCLIDLSLKRLSDAELSNGYLFKEDCKNYYMDAGAYKVTSKVYRVVDNVLPDLPKGKKLFIYTNDGIERGILEKRFINNPWVVIEK
jgi:hypothetical protein